MKFVKGVPFKGCKEPSWYLYIDGSLESHNLISNITNGNITRIFTDPHLRRDSVDAHILTNAISRLQISLILGERDGWYMNKVGGMCPNLFDISDTIETDHWPEEQCIKISKWPQGKHYHAIVNGIDVVDDDGNRKWNTVKAAERAVKKFMSAQLSQHSSHPLDKPGKDGQDKTDNQT